MCGWNQSASKAMREVATILRRLGMRALVKWDWIFCAPPLIIKKKQVQEGQTMLDKALAAADQHCVTWEE